MYLVNEFAAMITIPVLLLVMRGFMPFLWNRLVHSEQYPRAQIAMSVKMIILNPVLAVRMGYWDLWRPFTTGNYGTLSGSLANAGFNFAILAAAICALYALYYSIPEEDRHGWNIFTAPFYPKVCNIWRKSNAK